MINIQLIIESLPQLVYGALVTLKIASISTIIGLGFGTILALIQTSCNPFFSFLVTVYVMVIRGTPMLIQIFFVFYVLPQLGILLPEFWAAILAIGLNSSAYVSQTIRAGIATVSIGQREAAQVLGFSHIQIIYYIILPQALRAILPALGNELITLIKDSSLASIIGVIELTKVGNIIRSRTYDAITILFIVAVMYLIITSIVSLLVALLERKVTRHVAGH